MKQRVLSALQPQRVFYWFEELCAVPHGSRNTKQISDFIADFAKDRNLRYVQDEVNNVVIFKDGTAGYEDHAPVILQGHMDMVAEKTPESPIDFTKDGLDLCTDGETVWANGTTLGGDDGIAVAYALALLEATDLPHPPLECIFTVDEEIGMEGAQALDTSVLKGKTLINADSEDEGILTVSCAGGATSALLLPVCVTKTPAKGLKICVDGLIGGHSGQEINNGRANANILMGKLLSALSEEADFRLSAVCGGQKDNAIPRSSTAYIMTEEAQTDAVCKAVSRIGAALCGTLPAPEQSASITCAAADMDEVMDKASTAAVIGLLNAVPNGVQKMSSDIEGLVQTSLNLGILKTENGCVSMTFSVRSSVNEEKQELIGKLQQAAKDFGADYRQSGEYPAWEYRKESKLRDIMVATFEELYGRTPVVEAIHAGLECGLFSDKIEGLDAVSFGPDMQDIHTTREHLNIASVSRTWDYLLAILKKL